MCIVLLVYVVGFSCWQLETSGNLLGPAISEIRAPEKMDESEILPEKFATSADVTA
jgi:hypothetical protein